MNRLYAKRDLSKDSEGNDEKDDWVTCKEEDRASPGDANIITSVIYQDDNNTIHLPLIDLDIEHLYIKSSSYGHAHLYLNTQLTHEEYRELLRVLHKCGIIGKGTFDQLERDGSTQLRLPGIIKGEEYK